jgi:AcrR family transcriptional regulator
MGLLRKRFITTIEGTLDLQGIEYEDALEFVKFDNGRPATGALFTQARQFPDAAAELFVEVGYEATMMTAIAERSGSSIGVLYNYFPDKQAVALTLLCQYAQAMEEQWRPLIEQAENLTHREFASFFIERITEIFQVRPACLRLLAAPIRLRRDPAAKRVLRVNIANAFRAKNPSLSDEQAILAANVTLQIVRGLITL